MAIEREALESLRQSFDIETEPPLRAQLLRLDEDDHALVIKLHHLITDGWSQRLFWEELAALYGARLNGAASGLPKLAIQYRHFAEWQRAWLGTRAAEEQRSYWYAQLKGLTELPLRTDRPRPETRTGRGLRHRLQFSRALTRAIKSLSRDHRVTVFMSLLAAFQCLLYRYTEHDDVAVGSVIANRNQIQIERLIGMFANTIILRTDLSGDPKFSEVLRRVRQVTLDAHRHQDLPIEEILQALQASRSIDRNTLFQVMFILQNPSPGAPAFPGLSVNFLDVDPGIARVDLLLELTEADERLGGWLEYSTDLFEATTVARMAEHLQTLLEAIIANPEERISRLPLVPAGEQRRVLIDWNDTKTSFRRLGTFSERFAKQAERTPNAIAVSEGRISAQLPRARASELGHHRPARDGGGRPRRLGRLALGTRLRFPSRNDCSAAGRRSVSSPRPQHSPGKAGADHSAQPHTACARRARLRQGAWQGVVWDAGPRTPASPESGETNSGDAAKPRPAGSAGDLKLGLRHLYVGLNGCP